MARKKPHEVLEDDTPCQHFSARTGIVTNQPDGYDHTRSHCSVAVCGNPTCRARSIAYVQRFTGEAGIYIRDKRK